MLLQRQHHNGPILGGKDSCKLDGKACHRHAFHHIASLDVRSRATCLHSGDAMMKLYMTPESTVSRSVRLFVAENKIPMEEVVVDRVARYKPPYSTINPNCLVPMLVDGDLQLTESSAILKYLAEKISSPTYPKDLKQRAKVNEAMDFINTNLYRDFGYAFCYPQIFPHLKLQNDVAQAAALEKGKERSKRWLKVLNDHWIGPYRTYLCGDQITIADYFGACLVTISELIRADLSEYPNIIRWLNNMKKLPSWPRINEALYRWAAAVKDQTFVTIP
jgi:glutathione S-transferase